MSKAAKTARHEQRQSVLHRLPLSRIIKKSPLDRAKVTGIKNSLGKMFQWDVPERSTKTVKKAAAEPAVRKPASRKRRNRQLTIPLTGTTKLVISVKHAKAPAKKRPAKTTRTAQPRLSFAGLNRQAATALATILLGLSGTLYFGWHSVLASPVAPPPSASLSNEENVLKDVLAPASKSAHHYPKSTPTSISIPDIDVNTTISTIGNNPDGSMVVPTDWHTAGWYQYSPTPGQIGPAVIDGHLDNVSGLAVFWRLHELTPGEFIYISRADGTTVQFRVDSIRDYSQADFPTKTVYGNINYAGLRLITCGGTFNRLTHHYDQNTVVYATLVN